MSCRPVDDDTVHGCPDGGCTRASTPVCGIKVNRVIHAWFQQRGTEQQIVEQSRRATMCRAIRQVATIVGVTEEVRAYYAGFGEREWHCLESMADGRIEFAVTCDALAQYLPRHARVLDLGGGPGRYTIWLAQRGHRVTLVDLSHEMLELARQRIHEAGIDGQIDAIVETDARNLSAWADNSFDAVVCLGPFYHLPEAYDRDRVAAELRRVLVGNGVAFVALMPALAFLRRSLAMPDERRHLLEPGFIRHVLDDGVFINDVPGRFTQGYGVKLDDVGPFFSRFGFEQLALLSSESLTVGLETVLAELLTDEALRELVFQLAISHAGDASTLGLARHLLYVLVANVQMVALLANPSYRRPSTQGLPPCC